MADHELLVLSRPPEHVSAAEYNAWYDTHVGEVLALPGFVGATRMTAASVDGEKEREPRYTFCTRYEIEGDFATAWQALRSEVASGRMTFFDWFKDVAAAGWHCTPVRPGGESRASASHL